VLQDLDGSPSRESVILVHGNRGTAASGGDGLFFQDPFDPSFEPGQTTLEVSDNRLTLGDASGRATSGVTTTGAGHLRIRGNRLSGRAAAGVDVDRTSECRLRGNDLRGLRTGDGPDLRLGPSTSECVAVVSHADVVVDLGTANRVVRR
jgi:hypothetical protein